MHTNTFPIAIIMHPVGKLLKNNNTTLSVITPSKPGFELK